MPTTKSVTGSVVSPNPKTDDALKKLCDSRAAALQKFVELHKPLEEAVRAELESSPAGKELLRKRQQIQTKVAASLKRAQQKEIPQPAARPQLPLALNALIEEIRPQLAAVYARHTELLPTPRSLIEVLYGKEALNQDWTVDITSLPTLFVRAATSPMRLGLAQQPVKGSQPIVLNQAIPYALEEAWDSAAPQPSYNRASAFAHAATGYFSCSASTQGFGDCRARAVVGSNFAFPAGHNTFEVSADIECAYAARLSSYMVGSAAASADLWLIIDPGDGTPRIPTSQPLFSLMGYLVDYRSRTIEESYPETFHVSYRLTVSNARARTLKVLAGMNCHTSCRTGGWPTADVDIRGNVRNIRVSAV